jgi:hypothetical protein
VATATIARIFSFTSGVKIVLSLQVIEWIVVISLALFLLDRSLLWLEKRHWIYYRRSQGKATRFGNALLELQSIIEPETQHVLEVKREQRYEQVIPAAPPIPGKD